MRLSTHDLRRRPRCTDHRWSAPMMVAGMQRKLCVRCGQISLELTDASMRLPESLRKQSVAVR